MNICLCFVSDNEAMEFIKKKNDSLVPRPIIDNLQSQGIKPIFSFRFFSTKNPKKDLASFLLERKNDGIIVFLDGDIELQPASLYSAVFALEIDYSQMNYGNRGNFFSTLIAQGIRNFFIYKKFICDGNDQQAILLPLKNFNSQLIHELKSIFRHMTFGHNFDENLRGVVNALKKTKRPRRRGSSQESYFVDDDEKLFKYGLERHAQLATGTPHSAICLLTGTFRFGMPIDAGRHYNVFKENKNHTSISGTFLDCHDEQKNIPKTTHLNMFINDQIA